MFVKMFQLLLWIQICLKILQIRKAGLDIGVAYSQARGLLTKRFIYTYRRNAAVPSTYIYINGGPVLYSTRAKGFFISSR